MSGEAFTLTNGSDELRAVLVSAPPVYAPGGPVCLVEDWQGSEGLLAEAEQTAVAKGAVLTRVICAHDDQDRAELLVRRGYSIASEWYTARLPLPDTAPSEGIRRLTVSDVPRLLELGEQKRRQYEAYSPVFWRVSPLPRETFGPYLQAQIEKPETIALAHARGETIDGYILANGQGYVDDYMVAAPNLWPTVGEGLLLAAGVAAHRQGINSLLVVCGHGDQPMRTMLAAQGLTLTMDWYVRPLALEV